MDSTLAGIPNAVCYIGDILVAGVDSDSHLNVLSKVFDRLSSAGFQLKRSKCDFEKSSDLFNTLDTSMMGKDYTPPKTNWKQFVMHPVLQMSLPGNHFWD